jgi:translation initiation factor IF-2
VVLREVTQQVPHGVGGGLLVRDDQVVTEGRSIESLKRVKEDVREVPTGTECGIRVAGFDDIKPGDRIMCYKVHEIARRLGS